MTVAWDHCPDGISELMKYRESTSGLRIEENFLYGRGNAHPTMTVAWNHCPERH